VTRDPSAAIVWQVLHVLLDDTVDDTDIRNLFSEMRLQHSCATNRKASSKETEGFFRKVLGLYTHTYVSEMWCHFTYGSFRSAYVSFGAAFVTAKKRSDGNGFCKHTSFLLAFTVSSLE